MNLFATRDERYRTGVRGLEKVMRETILHRILFGKPKTLPPVVVYLSKFLVKESGMGLHNLVTPEKDNTTVFYMRSVS